MAVAEASFRISMEAMSFGLRPSREFTPSSEMLLSLPLVIIVGVEAVVIRTPSTTYSGSLEPFSEVMPRMRMATLPSGTPELLRTWTPAAWPCRSWSRDLLPAASSSAMRTEVTEPVRSLRRTPP